MHIQFNPSINPKQNNCKNNKNIAFGNIIYVTHNVKPKFLSPIKMIHNPLIEDSSARELTLLSEQEKLFKNGFWHYAKNNENPHFVSDAGDEFYYDKSDAEKNPFFIISIGDKLLRAKEEIHCCPEIRDSAISKAWETLKAAITDTMPKS